ncbi:MAG: hypothetical protein HRU76_12900 [Phycisphaeraceae bacterium]|nr:hypothetical protein [Phycisphaerales bacterium]QOJ18430.1 MAG: hypothetical protein HRU76_12900 [Phycisphaeraceae bacterium]
MSLPTRPIIPFHATLTLACGVLAAPAFAGHFNGDGSDDTAIGMPETIDTNDWFAIVRSA